MPLPGLNVIGGIGAASNGSSMKVVRTATGLDNGDSFSSGEYVTSVRVPAHAADEAVFVLVAYYHNLAENPFDSSVILGGGIDDPEGSSWYAVATDNGSGSRVGYVLLQKIQVGDHSVENDYWITLNLTDQYSSTYFHSIGIAIKVARQGGVIENQDASYTSSNNPAAFASLTNGSNPNPCLGFTWALEVDDNLDSSTHFVDFTNYDHVFQRNTAGYDSCITLAWTGPFVGDVDFGTWQLGGIDDYFVGGFLVVHEDADPVAYPAIAVEP